jgi:hypothetical protein
MTQCYLAYVLEALKEDWKKSNWLLLNIYDSICVTGEKQALIDLEK